MRKKFITPEAIEAVKVTARALNDQELKKVIDNKEKRNKELFALIHKNVLKMGQMKRGKGQVIFGSNKIDPKNPRVDKYFYTKWFNAVHDHSVEIENNRAKLSIYNTEVERRICIRIMEEENERRLADYCENGFPIG